MYRIIRILGLFFTDSEPDSHGLPRNLVAKARLDSGKCCIRASRKCFHVTVALAFMEEEIVLQPKDQVRHLVVT